MPETEERRTEEAFHELVEVVNSGAKPGELAGRSDQLTNLAVSAANGSGRGLRHRLKKAREKGPDEFFGQLCEELGQFAYERRLADFQRAVQVHARLKGTVALWLECCSPKEFFRERRLTVLGIARAAKGIPGADELIYQLEHAGDSRVFVKSVRGLLDQLWKFVSDGVPPKEVFRTSYPQRQFLSA